MTRMSLIITVILAGLAGILAATGRSYAFMAAAAGIWLLVTALAWADERPGLRRRART